MRFGQWASALQGPGLSYAERLRRGGFAGGETVKFLNFESSASFLNERVAFCGVFSRKGNLPAREYNAMTRL